MTARESLEGLGYSVKRLDSPTLVSVLESRANKLSEYFANIPPKEPDPFELEAARLRFIEADQKMSWSEISRRDWRNLPWLLWDSDAGLGKNSTIVGQFIKQLQLRSSAGTLRSLIFVYLRDFRVTWESTKVIADFIRSSLGHTKKQILVTWKERDEQYQLFNIKEGPREVAKKVLKDGNISEVLEHLGIVGELALGRFSSQAFEAALEYVARPDNRKKSTAGDYKSVISWGISDNKIVYPRSRIKMVEELLDPWLDQEPDEVVKRIILDSLTDTLGDPRVSMSKWQGIDPDTVDVLRRWLTGEALEKFFQILDQTALDRHWKYRKAFWMTYYNKKKLPNAKVILGESARLFARRNFEKGFISSAGRLYGASSDQSVLLMEVGDLIIAEWSHNGKCRAWHKSDGNAPSFTMKTYDRQDFMSASLKIHRGYQDAGISHQNSEGGHWQSVLSSFINRETGISANYREYMKGI